MYETDNRPEEFKTQQHGQMISTETKTSYEENN
jgi:hypothetical protein